MIGICARAATAAALAIAISWSATQFARSAEANDSWHEIATNAFNGRSLADGSGLITLEMPARAEDAAVVPVTMRANLPPGDTSWVNFTPQVAMGANVFVKSRAALALEGAYVHHSNAGLGTENPGYNAALVFTVGYSWFRRKE